MKTKDLVNIFSREQLSKPSKQFLGGGEGVRGRKQFFKSLVLVLGTTPGRSIIF